MRKERHQPMSNLNKAVILASEAHNGQVDKAGKPYILHPLRLMSKFSTEEEQIIALLHDVVEDSTMTFEELESYGFAKPILEALNCLTKRENEKYEDFIGRISSNSLATKVKISDIKDNMDLTRLKAITDKDLERVKKYHKALEVLLKK